MEEQYIPYGQDQVDVQEMNKLLADNVESYLSSKRWSPEQKNKWRQAYGDLMSRGILGISTDGGRYSIEHNGVPFVDTEGYYGDVANFITTNLSSIAKKKEEEKKVELPKYNLDQDFTSYFMNQYYGGTGESNFENFQNTWSNLDKVDKYGIRGTDVRRGRLKEALQNYVTYLDENKDKYNYDNGVFKNLDDLKGRLNAAIHAMDTPGQQDDIDALNALGIRPDFLDTGANRTVTLTDGTQMTASQYRDQDLKQQEQAKLASNKQTQANQFKKVRFISAKNFNGTPPTGQNVLEKLNGYYSLGKLNGQQYSELMGTFKFAERNNALKPLSKEELAAFGSFRGANRLRKIDGLNGFYWDSAGQRIVQPFMNSDDGTQSFQDLVNQKDPKILSKKQAEVNMNTAFKDIKEFTPEMKKEIEALAWDTASILDPEAFSGSAMALYASHLRDEANPNRGTLEKWFDRGTAALGGIQGFGDLLVTGKLGYRLYQLGKSIGSVSKFAGILGTGFGAIGAFEARDSIAKIANPSSLTPQDLENIAYGLMGLIGLKSFNKARTKQTIGKQANSTVTEHSITVKDNNNKTHEIKIDESTAKEIQQVRTLGKKKETVNSEILNMPKIKESIQKYKIEGASIVNDSKSVFGISGKNKVVTSKQVRNPNAPEYAPVGTKWYNPVGGYMAQGNNKWGYYLGGGWQRKAWKNATPEQSSKGLWQRAKEFWNPEPKPIQSEKMQPQNNQSETPKPIETSKQKSVEISKQSKERIKKYNESVEKRIKDLDEGKFSKNKLKSGNLDIAGHKLQVVEQSDGTFNLIYKGNIQGNFQKHEQRKLQEAIREIIRNRTVRIDPNTRIKSIGAEEIGKVLQDLKRKGWLKKGGKIDSTEDIINNYFKNKQI